MFVPMHRLLRRRERSLLPSVILSMMIVVACAAPRAFAQDQVKLWPGGAPGSEGKTGGETVVPSNDGARRVSTIHQPSLLVYLPTADKRTGAAVIVMPGGGHRYLTLDNEGTAVAKWLGERGVAGFVLKYRLAREEGSTYTVENHALHDAQRAVRLVRSRAAEWKIDPARIGVLGFSAGGELAGLAATRFDTGRTEATDAIERASSRPDFQALIYPGGRVADWTISANVPPAFLCVAADDQNPQANSVALYQKFRDAGVKTELHIYAAGGHGFGMRERPLPISAWPTRLYEWMAQQGLLAAGAPASPSASR
jgi:acetyl esterase/lipase